VANGPRASLASLSGKDCPSLQGHADFEGIFFVSPVQV
jgi:hypothetical protein